MPLNKSCPIARLSLDVLAEIFLLGRPPPLNFDTFMLNNSFNDLDDEFNSIENHYPLKLGAVCASWRKVAWSTPSLWTSFAYSSVSRSPESRKLAAPFFLNLYIQNSRNLQIHLYFGNRSTRYPLDTLVGSLIQINASRIETLLLFNPPSTWFNYLDKWISLVNLAIRWNYATDPVMEELFLNRCHRLRRLSIDAPGPETVLCKLPWSLTVLHLSNTPIDTCIKLLLRCPNLEGVTIDKPQLSLIEPDDALLQSWFGYPIVFKHLRSLSWCRVEYPDPWPDAFLDRVETPFLATFRLAFPYGEDYPLTNGERSFLERLPQTCSSLELEQLQYLADIPRIFEASSPLKKVTLEQCDMASLYEILDKLKHVVEGSGEILKPMPGLTTLTIRRPTDVFGNEDDTPDLDELEPRHFEPLVDMLERRLQAEDKFLLRFEGVRVDWTPGVQRRLRSLLSRGVQLDIIDGLDVVDWLRVD